MYLAYIQTNCIIDLIILIHTLIMLTMYLIVFDGVLGLLGHA